MNVLREIFHWVKEEGDHKAAAHLGGYGRGGSSGFTIGRWRNEECAWAHDDRALVPFQRPLVDRGHLWVARNDVARAIVGWQFDEDASVLGHPESDNGFILRYVDLRFANKEVWASLRRRRGHYGHRSGNNVLWRSLHTTATCDRRFVLRGRGLLATGRNRCAHEHEQGIDYLHLRILLALRCRDHRCLSFSGAEFLVVDCVDAKSRTKIAIEAKRAVLRRIGQ